jgi:hypothetical protein
MGVEFRMSSGDHKVVEDFLAGKPAGVAGVVLSARGAHKEQTVAEQARDIGVEVYWDPTTDRLTRPGFSVPGVTDAVGVLQVEALRSSPSLRRQLAETVWRAHPDYVTAGTPPHLAVESTADWTLNLELANRFRDLAGDKTVRPPLILSSRLGIEQVHAIAASYVAQGFTVVELRVTPFGGEDEGPRKIREAFATLQAFVDAGLQTTLGCSGNLGQAAMAVGHVQHYSVGVGMLEKVNHAATIARQQKPRVPGKGFGAQAGLYLAPLAYTAPIKLGEALLATAGIRTRVGCRLGTCNDSVAGPSANPREHYLHARAHEADLVIERPAAWRITGELDRLRMAKNLRNQVNEKYLPAGRPPMKTRTLSALIDTLEEGPAQQVG